MSTTALFVELVVIGVGALAAVLLGSMTLLGFDPERLRLLLNPNLLIPELAVTYLFGIIVDRLANLCFKKWSKSKRLKIFSSIEAFQKARANVYENSPFRQSFEYIRSRLRICRGWVLNSVLLAVSIDAFLVQRVADYTLRTKLIVFSTTFLILLGLLCLYLWHHFLETEVKKIGLQDQLLVGSNGEESE